MNRVFEDIGLRSFPPYLALPVLVGVGLALAGDGGLTPAASGLAVTLAEVGGVLLFLLHAFGRAGVSPLDYALRPPRRPMPLGSLCGIALSKVVFSLSALWVVCTVLLPLAPDYVEGLFSGGSRLWVSPDESEAWVWLNTVTAVHACILAPVVEELFFRGWLLHRLAHKFGPLCGVLVSSLLFGITHPNVFGATVSGLVLCAVTLHSGSLRGAITLHALNNLIVLAVSCGIRLLPVPEMVITTSDLPAGLLWAVAALVASGAALAWLMRHFTVREWLVQCSRPHTARGMPAAVAGAHGSGRN